MAAVRGSAAVHRLGPRLQLRDTRRLIWFGAFAAIIALGLAFFSDKSLARSIFLGALVGMLAQWWGTCSAVVEIPDNALSASTIEQWLKARGYRDGPSPGVLKFKHPDWASFASQTITLQRLEGVTRITGPYFILKTLARLALDARPIDAETSRNR